MKNQSYEQHSSFRGLKQLMVDDEDPLSKVNLRGDSNLPNIA